MQFKKLTGVRKIAILRANALGDFVVALPAFKALRYTYPNAEIVLLGKPWNKEYIQGRNTCIDRVIVIPVSHGVRLEPGQRENKEELKTFFKEIQKEQFDIAIQLHGGGRNSNPFVKKLGAKMTVGMRTPDAPHLDRDIPYIFYQHEVHRYLEVVSLIGAKTQTIEPEIEVLPSDLEEADRLFKHISRPYIVLHTGASDPQRRWPAEKFAALGDKLAKQGFEIVFTGVNSEKEITNTVKNIMNIQPVDLCGKVTLGGLTGILTKASLLISNDTGPLHLARALKTPTLGIYWFHNLINWGPITRARNRTVVSTLMQCDICNEELINSLSSEPIGNSLVHEHSIVANVSVKKVLEQCKELITSLT